MPPTAPITTHLILVRHGQSLFNRDGANMGDNSGLTELGWRQSQLVADWLAHTYQVDALLSSPLTRAQQTAEVIGQRLGLPVRLVPGLEEADQPYWGEFPVAPENAPLTFWDHSQALTEEHTPLYSAFRARVRGALAQILADHAGKTLIVVSHGGTIGTILRSLFGWRHMSVFTENSGVTHLAWQGGQWRLIIHNSQAHLAALNPPGTAAPAPNQPARAPWAADHQIQAVIDHYRRVANAYPKEPVIPGEKDLQALIKLAAPSKDARVLDVATGAGVVACAFAPHVGQVVGVDISPAMLERAEQLRLSKSCENVQFRWANATALPFPAQDFDLLTCRDLLSYVTDPQAVLAEFRRVLKPGGALLLDEIIGTDDPVKRATQEAIEIRRNPSFLHTFSGSAIEGFVHAAGFQVTKAERYALPRRLNEWLAYAAADAATSATVRTMVEASLETDAAGLSARQGRDGAITLTHHRLRLLAIARARQEHPATAEVNGHRAPDQKGLG